MTSVTLVMFLNINKLYHDDVTVAETLALCYATVSLWLKKTSKCSGGPYNGWLSLVLAD